MNDLTDAGTTIFFKVNSNGIMYCIILLKETCNAFKNREAQTDNLRSNFQLRNFSLERFVLRWLLELQTTADTENKTIL